MVQKRQTIWFLISKGKGFPLPEFRELERGFLDTLVLLGDALSKIVMVGGWCPYLYAQYLWRKKIPSIPTTTDIDFGVVETGPKRFDMTVYDRLKEAGLAIERIYEEEEVPIEFVYKKGETELKIEFITSFETSDDTLNRFLGNKLACNRIEAFELLLRDLVSISLEHSGKELTIQIPSPAAFLYHKGVTFVMRSNETKRDKDLFYVYFVLKFCPDRKELLQTLSGFEGDEYVENFRRNLREYLSNVAQPGYRMLRPFVRRWVGERKINEEIKAVFHELFRIL